MGSRKDGTSHVCTRPDGSPQCFWMNFDLFVQVPAPKAKMHADKTGCLDDIQGTDYKAFQIPLYPIPITYTNSGHILSYIRPGLKYPFPAKISVERDLAIFSEIQKTIGRSCNTENPTVDCSCN